MTNSEDTISTLLEQSGELHSLVWENKLEEPYYYALEEHQPEKASWLSLDVVASTNSAQDWYYGVTYKDTDEFKQALMKWFDVCMSDELLELYRKGEVTNIRLVIGPETLSGSDLNEENGIEIKPKYQGKKQ